MLTLDPSSETYRGPYHRAYSRRLRSLVLIAASTDDRSDEDIRLWQIVFSNSGSGCQALQLSSLPGPLYTAWPERKSRLSKFCAA
jgi:hypothetical protein